MGISLQRFTEKSEAVIPIINGWGQFEGRKLWLATVSDGWYRIAIGNTVEVMGTATLLDIYNTLKNAKYSRVYALGNEGIPINFNNLFQRGHGESVKVNFLNLDIFAVARVVEREDKRFYFIEEDIFFNRSLLNEMKGRFDSDQGIDDMNHITPELRYYFFLLNLQRQSYREYEKLEKLALSEAERDKRIQEFQSTFAGRLQSTIEKAGGSLVKFSKKGNGFLVEWKVTGSDQLVKSVIKDDLEIISLGYCASGHDKEHSLSSAVQLAKMYGNLYITRT